MAMCELRWPKCDSRTEAGSLLWIASHPFKVSERPTAKLNAGAEVVGIEVEGTRKLVVLDWDYYTEPDVDRPQDGPRRIAAFPGNKMHFTGEVWLPPFTVKRRFLLGSSLLHRRQWSPSTRSN